jgi:lactoylglutathione lyase
MDAGAESISEPERLEHWPVTAAFVRDPDGYMVEILETHGESPAISGPGSGDA